jgi:hypothetical protein
MQASIREALAERLLEIPEILRDALLGQSFSISIAEISDRYKLSEYQEIMFEKETAFLIAGIIRPEEYISRLAEEMEVPPTIAKHLAAEANLWIFNPIKDELFSFHEELAAVVEAAEQEQAAIDAKKEPENPNLPEPISEFLKTLNLMFLKKEPWLKMLQCDKCEKAQQKKPRPSLLRKKYRSLLQISQLLYRQGTLIRTKSLLSRCILTSDAVSSSSIH